MSALVAWKGARHGAAERLIRLGWQGQIAFKSGVRTHLTPDNGTSKHVSNSKFPVASPKASTEGPWVGEGGLTSPNLQRLGPPLRG